MDWIELLEEAKKRGEESQRRWNECRSKGGHYKSSEFKSGKDIYIKCRCGFYCVKKAEHKFFNS